jgi:iron complex transport system substrate-binding protein
LNIPVRVVDQKDIPGILESVHAVAKFLKVPGRARSIVKSIRGRMDRVTRAVSNRPRPRVMLSLGRNMGSASLDRVYLAGRYGLYHEMIRLCGGANAYRGGLAFPCVSREGILRLDPEVIIELIPEIEDSDTRIGEAREAWNAFKEVEAVQNGRVYVMGHRDVLVPGPGFIDVCERMARMIHPEVEW